MKGIEQMPPTTLDRHMKTEIEEALLASRVVNLVGPRQSGKTTLVRDLLETGEFITLDDQGVLNAINTDAFGLLWSRRQALKDTALIIDEVQRSMSLALAIKRIVDGDRRRGQFLLTGPSNVFTSANIPDSLAGRVLTLKLWPLSLTEIEMNPPCKILDWATQTSPELSDLPQPSPLTRKDVIHLILKGGYPNIRNEPLRTRQRIYRDYINTVIDRDVADVFPIRKPDALRRLINQVAARTGNELNISTLASKLGIQRQTVDKYLEVLTSLSIIIRLGHWASGEGSRDIKNAKYHFVDMGLACALRRLKEDTFEISKNPEKLGGLLEGYVLNEIVRSLPFQSKDMELYHWRNRNGREIDILVDAGTHMIGIEVKASTTVGSKDFRHLKWFAANGPGKSQNMTGIIFYLGEHALPFGNGYFALPIAMLST